MNKYDLVKCPICAIPWKEHDSSCEGRRHKPDVPLSPSEDSVIAVNSGVQVKRAENLVRYPNDVMPPKATHRNGSPI